MEFDSAACGEACAARQRDSAQGVEDGALSAALVAHDADLWDAVDFAVHAARAQAVHQVYSRTDVAGQYAGERG
jgi:hypothetical protein